MEVLISLVTKLAEKPETGVLGMISIMATVIIWKLLTMLVESRTRNLQLDAEVKSMQQQRIVDLQEVGKTLERNAVANQAVANVLNSALPLLIAKGSRP